jgi:hypothetical protein
MLLDEDMKWDIIFMAARSLTGGSGSSWHGDAYVMLYETIEVIMTTATTSRVRLQRATVMKSGISNQRGFPEVSHLKLEVEGMKAALNLWVGMRENKAGNSRRQGGHVLPEDESVNVCKQSSQKSTDAPLDTSSWVHNRFTFFLSFFLTMSENITISQK